jgi:hypothetical protein
VHEAEIAAHRAEIARHEEALTHGAAHAPAPPASDHAAAAEQHGSSGTHHAKLTAAILALGHLLSDFLSDQRLLLRREEPGSMSPATGDSG